VRLAYGRRPDPMVDLTPMIDIVFQLVLFFMVTTTFKSSPAIQIDLPRSSRDLVVAERDDVLIWVAVDGALFLDQRPVGWTELGARLAAAAAARDDTLVILKADRGVEHGRVVAVMDLARGYGLTRLAIATEPERGEDRPPVVPRSDPR
jgi:biopolymer transport protein ExbD